MLLKIQNEQLTLEVSTLGAEMMSLRSADGIEYLWQGDPAYWTDRAPNLFPFIARLTDNSYKYMGKTYPMTIHGFALSSEFTVAEQGQDWVTLELESNEQTLQQYPFDFVLRITYRLQGNTLDTVCSVQNRSDVKMPFAIGGHPGFNVPLVSGERFEDYKLVFSQPCQPDRILFTQQLYVSGQTVLFPLVDGTTIPLRHDLFDDEAIILKNAAKEVTLLSNVSGRGVRVSYPDMPYIGFWKMQKIDSPYVCIEPWSSLPSRQDVVEEFTCKSDMLQLPAGQTHETGWTITIL